MEKIIVSALLAMILLITAVSCSYSKNSRNSDEYPDISVEELMSFAEQSGEVYSEN